MGYKLYRTAQGEFAIHWDTCCQIIRSYHRAELQTRYSRERRESEGAVDPTPWYLPDLTFIEVDWARVNQQSQSDVLSAAFRLAAVALFQRDGVDSLVRELKRMQAETRRLNAAFIQRQRTATAKSWKTIESYATAYDWGLTFLKGIRDVSASILIGGSTVVTGGATAAAVAGAGTVLKGVAKYQDTPSDKHPGAVAAVEVSQQIVCYVIPGARQLPMGKALKVIISTGADTGKALIEGEAVETAVAVGLVNLPTAAGGAAAKQPLDDLLKKKGIREAVRKAAVPIAVKVAEDGAKKSVQSLIKNRQAGGSMQQDARDATKTTAPRFPASFESDLLLKLAVVDMAKGIGHSWW